MIGILLDQDYKLLIKPKRDSEGKIISGFVLGDARSQIVALVLQMYPGELKEDPVLGPGLTKFISGKHSKSEMNQRIRQHLTRAGINYNAFKHGISTTINNDTL